MRSVMVSSQDLEAVATPRLSRYFELTDNSIRFDDVEIPNGEAAILIMSAPRAADGAPPNLRSEIAPGVVVQDTCPFIDIYLLNGLRLKLCAELVDFCALGERKTVSMQRKHFDDRLQNMQLRRRAGHSVPQNFKEARKGFSFASPGLDTLLADISPDLASISQTELSSRLAYLSTRAHIDRFQDLNI